MAAEYSQNFMYVCSNDILSRMRATSTKDVLECFIMDESIRHPRMIRMKNNKPKSTDISGAVSSCYTHGVMLLLNLP